MISVSLTQELCKSLDVDGWSRHAPLLFEVPLFVVDQKIGLLFRLRGQHDFADDWRDVADAVLEDVDEQPAGCLLAAMNTDKFWS